MQRSPRLLDLPRTRWWLAGVRQVIPWLASCCLATVWHTLERWDVHDKRGRRSVHSPDWEYATNVWRIETITWYSRQAPQQIVRRDVDELTSSRRPTVAQGYAPAGSDTPHAKQGQGSNTSHRIAACLDVETGRLLGGPRAHFDRETLLRFYQAIEQAYPKAEQIFLIHDNWPVHWHPDLVASLRGSKLALVALPTYAPWLNPVEKVWRKLYQEVLHLHPWVDAWERLQATVQTWLEQWANGSTTLLRYVGLWPT